jgi:hypothetical protein
MSTRSHSPESEESEKEVSVWDDDGAGNLMALFVLDDIPAAVSPTHTR